MNLPEKADKALSVIQRKVVFWLLLVTFWTAAMLVVAPTAIFIDKAKEALADPWIITYWVGVCCLGLLVMSPHRWRLVLLLSIFAELALIWQ